ncbi:MAG: HEPN domain-containing protein [Candidatus Methanoperedens sp.]|nr:HEPN domain-containing protein [Candidatus Methanoperedens sp.]
MTEASLPSDWMSIARKDWNRMHHMLDYDDVEASAVFLQQALEKYLKAFLLQHGWKLRKIHELDALLDDAAKYNPALENYRDLCERVSGYYFVERYPPLGTFDIRSEDIKKHLSEAKKFVKAMFPYEKLKE